MTRVLDDGGTGSVRASATRSAHSVHGKGRVVVSHASNPKKNALELLPGEECRLTARLTLLKNRRGNQEPPVGGFAWTTRLESTRDSAESLSPAKKDAGGAATSDDYVFRGRHPTRGLVRVVCSFQEQDRDRRSGAIVPSDAWKIRVLGIRITGPDRCEVFGDAIVLTADTGTGEDGAAPDGTFTWARGSSDVTLEPVETGRTCKVTGVRESSSGAEVRCTFTPAGSDQGFVASRKVKVVSSTRPAVLNGSVGLRLHPPVAPERGDNYERDVAWVKNRMLAWGMPAEVVGPLPEATNRRYGGEEEVAQLARAIRYFQAALHGLDATYIAQNMNRPIGCIPTGIIRRGDATERRLAQSGTIDWTGKCPLRPGPEREIHAADAVIAEYAYDDPTAPESPGVVWGSESIFVEGQANLYSSDYFPEKIREMPEERYASKWRFLQRAWDAINRYLPPRYMTSSFRTYQKQRELLRRAWTSDKARTRLLEYYRGERGSPRYLPKRDDARDKDEHGSFSKTKHAERMWEEGRQLLDGFASGTRTPDLAVGSLDAHDPERFSNPGEQELARAIARCGLSAIAAPGRSNHQQGVAFDIGGNGGGDPALIFEVVERLLYIAAERPDGVSVVTILPESNGCVHTEYFRA